MAYLIPNGNIRMEVMGLDPRPARDDELRAMQKLVREGMDAGAIGLSTGLDYIPSRYADAREIAALVRADRRGERRLRHPHAGLRRRAAAGMREVYDIAQATGVPAHVSHYNGPADLLLPLIDEGRALGLDLTYDTYPYLAASTILGMVALPAWVQEGGIEATVERLRDPAVRARLKSEWFVGRHALRPGEHHDRHGGPSRLAVGRGTDRHGGGRAGQASIRATSSARFSRPRTWRWESWASAPAIGPRPTSGRSCVIPPTWRAPTASSAAAFPHPRGWGAFARYLGYHTRQLGDYSWPEAVTHLATHAARRFRLTDRGLDPPRLRRRHRRLRPGQRDRPLDLRRRAGLWPRGSITCWSTGPWSWKTASRPERRPARTAAGMSRTQRGRIWAAECDRSSR